MMRALRRLGAAAVLALVSLLLLLTVQPIATPGTAAPRQVPAGSLRAAGTLLITEDHAILQRNAATGVQRTLRTFPDDEYIRSPLWLPGGQTFLYIDQKAYTGDPTADVGGDVWQANADGSSPKLIWRHDAKGVDLDGLALSSDGSFLLFGYVRTDTAPNGNLIDQVIEVRRYDLAAQRTTTVLENASNPALSPDGRTIVYLNVGESGNDDFGLWTADVDGSNPQPLVTMEQWLSGFFSPRFSPDGSRVLFPGYLTPAFITVSPPAPTATPGPPSGLLNGLRAPVASADGPPQDIWVVNTDGSGLVRVSNIFEDQPSAAWSADSSQIAIYGQTGFYLVQPDGSAFTRVGDGYLHAQIAWLQP